MSGGLRPPAAPPPPIPPLPRASPSFFPSVCLGGGARSRGGLSALLLCSSGGLRAAFLRSFCAARTVRASSSKFSFRFARGGRLVRPLLPGGLFVLRPRASLVPGCPGFRPAALVGVSPPRGTESKESSGSCFYAPWPRGPSSTRWVRGPGHGLPCATPHPLCRAIAPAQIVPLAKMQARSPTGARYARTEARSRSNLSHLCTI